MTIEQSLNKMQVAYLVGRMNYLPLGGVAMHDFREFRGDINIDIFTECLQKKVIKHSALRTIIDQTNFTQSLAEHGEVNLTVVDYRNSPRHEALKQAELLRAQVSHYKHDSGKSPWGVWLLKINKEQDTDFNTVIFFSFDGLILDGYSISLLINEVITGYMRLKSDRECDDEKTINKNIQNTDFYLNKETDKTYWLEKITLLKPNKFPWRTPLERIPQSRYQRRGLAISREIWNEITKYSKKSGVFPNSLINTIVLRALCKLTNNASFYVGLPVSFSLYQNELSNNSTVIPLNYTECNRPLLEAAKDIQTETMNGLFHISFSGVEIARNLCVQFKTSIPFPIVLTNALSWVAAPYYSDFYYAAGLTQTPQIGLDIRIYLSSQETLLIDIDFAEEAVSEDIVKQLLAVIQEQMALVHA
ncbi:hypothetical protein JMY81_15620 [Brenneria goodwinii]|nr:condensation domain-containing protein [Brenneria goodwinii]MCG8157284.1 hypothetical protein [Brenneria goodwinii]MCG8162238.1 hypothetical protein [Brenneria goodwinii]MCG8166168.1 hypothetical protein [Brenneria goodwinii]MCG8170795.1 hypothetical protein [Brenneria goodwinii]MCG8175865.1 hypothetical protein [Brenneria goodwinii]